MSKDKIANVTRNNWQHLRDKTNARIALGRAGNSLPTNELLKFQLDHANAQDAVMVPLDLELLLIELSKDNYVVRLSSEAKSRDIYIQRPDLGKRLSETSRQRLFEYQKTQPFSPRVAIVVADGLSSKAVQNHAPKMVDSFLALLAEHKFPVTPICTVSQGRVAIGDEIGQILGAEMVVVIIGERPGLSSADSLGIYYTYNPKIGRHDSERNCISNIHPKGLSYTEAAEKLMWIVLRSIQLQKSGVVLKEQADALETHSNIKTTKDTFLLKK